MRVVVSYKNQLAYVPKAMFYAGRCFQLLADDEFADEKADKLYKKLIRTFDGTRWANEARAFRPKKVIHRFRPANFVSQDPGADRTLTGRRSSKRGAAARLL